MEISKIKEALSLTQVLENYALNPKNNMLCCPFHEDKTASLQVNLEKDFYKCHACGAKGDQIQFVQDFDKLSKREAILKCVSMINPNNINIPIIENKKTTPIVPTNFLEKMFSSFKNGLNSSNPAKDYCKKRNLDYTKLEIGFNSGQFHHGERKSEELINNCLDIGLLLDRNLKNDKSYSVFGKYGIVFPLKNKENQIVSLYFRSVLDKDNAKHFYLKNRTGLYPSYPKPTTKKLILTESIIDCASLLQIDEITNNYSVLACYGTNGLNEEIQKAILELEKLEEIIFCFDNDDAGKEAVKKYSEQFKKHKISTIELPNKDINETLQLHENEIFIELLNNRNPILFSDEEMNFSIEEKISKKPIEEPKKLPYSNSKLPTAIDFLKQKNLLSNLNPTCSYSSSNTL